MTAVVVLFGVAIVYVRGWYRLRRAAGKRPPASELAAFVSGLGVLWIAVGSPIATLHHASLTIHMTQHLLLMAAAAPLILAGAPAMPLLCGLPAPVHRTLDSIFRLSGVRKTWRTLSHPACGWLFAAGVVMGWHVPAAFSLAMHERGWYVFQQVSFFAGGLLFWLPVLRPWPNVARWPAWSVPLYLFAATLPCDALSAYLVFCDRVVYPHDASASGLFGMTPIQDQALAGALMWVTVTVVYGTAAVTVTMRLLATPALDSERPNQVCASGNPNPGDMIPTNDLTQTPRRAEFAESPALNRSPRATRAGGV